MKLLRALIVLCYLRYSTACNGYSLKVVKYKNCVDEPIIKLPEKDFNVVIDKDCNLYATGCIEITKDFTTAKGTYKAKKPPLPQMDGDVDLCGLSDQLKSMPDVAAALDVLGIPTKCPVSAKTICGGPDKKVSLGKFKNQIGMAAGSSEFKIEIEHDTGKSCMEFHSSINKARKG